MKKTAMIIMLFIFCGVCFSADNTFTPDSSLYGFHSTFKLTVRTYLEENDFMDLTQTLTIGKYADGDKTILTILPSGTAYSFSFGANYTLTPTETFRIKFMETNHFKIEFSKKFSISGTNFDMLLEKYRAEYGKFSEQAVQDQKAALSPMSSEEQEIGRYYMQEILPLTAVPSLQNKKLKPGKNIFNTEKNGFSVSQSIMFEENTDLKVTETTVMKNADGQIITSLQNEMHFDKDEKSIISSRMAIKMPDMLSGELSSKLELSLEKTNE